MNALRQFADNVDAAAQAIRSGADPSEAVTRAKKKAAGFDEMKTRYELRRLERYQLGLPARCATSRRVDIRDIVGDPAGAKLQARVWEPEEHNGTRSMVIYLPGDYGIGVPADEAEMEAFAVACHVVPMRAAFSWIEPRASKSCLLGYTEADVRRTIDIFRTRKGYGMIALWGRGLGADLAMRLAADVNLSIAALILEGSPAGDLMSAMDLPDWLTSPIYGIQNLVQSVPSGPCSSSPPVAPSTLGPRPALARAKSPAATSPRRVSFGEEKVASAAPKEPLEPLMQVAERCFMPAVFIHGDRDKVVQSEQIKKLRGAYAGGAQMFLLEDCDHHSILPPKILAQASLVLARSLMRDLDVDLNVKDVIAEIERMANKKSDIVPLSFTDDEFDQILGEDQPPAKRIEGFFLATQAALSAFRATYMQQRATGLPPAASHPSKEIRLRVVAWAVFPAPAVKPLVAADSEVFLTWAGDNKTIDWGPERESCFTSGLVYVARVSRTLASFSLVKVWPRSFEEIRFQVDKTHAVGVGYHEVDHQVISLTEVPLKPGCDQHKVELTVHRSGVVDFLVGGKRISPTEPLKLPIYQDLMLWSGSNSMGGLRCETVEGELLHTSMGEQVAAERANRQANPEEPVFCRLPGARNVAAAEVNEKLQKMGCGGPAIFRNAWSPGKTDKTDNPPKTIRSRSRGHSPSGGIAGRPATLMSNATFLTKQGDTLTVSDSESEHATANRRKNNKSDASDDFGDEGTGLTVPASTFHASRASRGTVQNSTVASQDQGNATSIGGRGGYGGYETCPASGPRAGNGKPSVMSV